jgi:hypothetical protein
MKGRQDPTLAIAAGHLEIGALLRHPAADRARKLDAERGCVIGPARLNGDDAAEGVGSVRDRSGTSCDLDATDYCGVEERRVRTGPSLGRHAALVQQNQRAAARQAAHGRHRALPFGDCAHACHVSEGLAKRGRMLRSNLLAREPGGRGARRDVDRRRRTRHRQGLAHSGFHDQCRSLGRVRARDLNRPRHASVRQNHDDDKRRCPGWIPSKAAGRAAALGSALSDDHHLGPRDRQTRPRVDHQSFDRRRRDEQGCETERAGECEHHGLTLRQRPSFAPSRGVTW